MPHGAAFSGLVPKFCSYVSTKIGEKLRLAVTHDAKGISRQVIAITKRCGVFGEQPSRMGDTRPYRYIRQPTCGLIESALNFSTRSRATDRGHGYVYQATDTNPAAVILPIHRLPASVSGSSSQEKMPRHAERVSATAQRRPRER